MKPADNEKLMVHLRIDKMVIREVDHFSVDWDLFRHEAIEMLLAEALKKRKQEDALKPA